MKYGIIGVNVGGAKTAEMLVALAKKAEEVGMESLWTFEHVVVPLEYKSRYPGHPSGKMPGTPENHFIDPLIALSYVAAHTKTLRLGTGINIVPQTNPLLLAKQVASLDVLSGGRLTLGMGVGWLAEEYAAMGTPFRNRGARMDDYLVALKKVWSGEVVEHQSEFLSWSGFKSYPLPVQKPHPPLVFGGSAPGVLRRIGRHGDGWIGGAGSMEALKKLCDTLDSEARAAGRDPASIEKTVMWPYAAEGPDAVRQYEDLGVARLVIRWQALGGENPLAALEEIGNKLIAKG